MAKGGGLIIAIALMNTSAAWADSPRKPPVYFCKPATDIEASVEECEDNDAFIDQGEDCLDKLDAEIAASTTAMKAAFSADANSQQSAKFQSSQQDYAQSSATLAYLISLAQLSVHEMDSYMSNLAAPEDVDEPDVNEGDAEKYAMGVTCYGETTRSLQSIQNNFTSRLNQLQATKKVADANASSSAGRGQKIDGSSAVGQKLLGGKGTGSGASQGSSTNKGSDITGVQQDQNKQLNQGK